MMLDGLNPTNTFERKLLDVLVALHRDGTPIPVQITPLAPATDDRTRDEVAALRLQVGQLIAAYQQLEADYQQLLGAITEHTHETIAVQSEAA